MVAAIDEVGWRRDLMEGGEVGGNEEADGGNDEVWEVGGNDDMAGVGC